MDSPAVNTHAKTISISISSWRENSFHKLQAWSRGLPGQHQLTPHARDTPDEHSSRFSTPGMTNDITVQGAASP
jgi:hypothetical protein